MSGAVDATIIEAMEHEAVWRGWFRDPVTWAPWRTFLRTLFGLPLEDAELDLFRCCTGRTAPPEGGFTEAWLVCGRRAGKSFILALIAVYIAVFRDWRSYLAPGELGYVKVLAVDQRQARIVRRYAGALLSEVPAIKPMVVRETEDAIWLDNRIVIEVQPASFRSIRGFSVVAALLDEMAFWRQDESANPDAEVLAALRPAMASVPGSMLLAASSPYARRGELWRAYRQHFGKDGDPVLVWQADTRTMNPTIPPEVVAEAMERDPASAAAEYLAQFRSDIESFVAREAVEAATVPGRLELPPIAGTRYFGFVDPSGGSADSMTMAIAHRHTGGRAVLDLVREQRPPFSPESTVEDFAATLRAYRIAEVRGDRYGGDWPAEQFRKRGVNYKPSERAKSDIYRELLAPLNSGSVELLDHGRLLAQLVALERRTARGGRDSIDHPPGGHDDLINSAAGALVLAAGKAPSVGSLVTPAILAAARRPNPRAARLAEYRTSDSIGRFVPF